VGLCFEQGLGTAQSKTEAVNYFRSAAQRGSRFAYEELKRIYDEQRPPDKEFLLSN
jgi:TPR repeat protein